MQQLQLQFFWPLTEQIPLDLDYTGCETPKLSVPVSGTYYSIENTNWGITSSVAPGHVSIDIDTVVIKSKEKPQFYRRALYKMLGIKWEKK